MKQVVAELKRQSKRLGTIVSEFELIRNDENSTKSLVLKRNKGYMEFLCHDKSSGVFEYLGKDKKHTLSVLAKNRYGGKIVKLALHLKKTVDACIGRLDGIDLKEEFSKLFDSVPPELVKYIEPWDDDEINAMKWQERCIQKSRRRNDTGFYTVNGEHVRSKSEVLIADRLCNRGIPYHYEPVFRISEDEWLYPDFLVLNKHTRQEFLWEHFGRMDDPSYCADAIGKMELYAALGYYQGVNLLCTFESSGHPLSLCHVDRLIEKHLKG